MPAKKTHEQVLSDHAVELPNGCIQWTGARDGDGYGKCRRFHEVYGWVWLPHRLAFHLRFGKIPEGKEVDHRCRNRGCINADHLEAVTHADNTARSVYETHRHRNGRKTQCKRGHPLTGANLITEVWGGKVSRKCKACKKITRAARIHGISITEV